MVNVAIKDTDQPARVQADLRLYWQLASHVHKKMIFHHSRIL